MVVVADSQQPTAVEIYSSQIQIGISKVVVDMIFLACHDGLKKIVVGMFKIQIIAPVEIAQIIECQRIAPHFCFAALLISISIGDDGVADQCRIGFLSFVEIVYS